MKKYAMLMVLTAGLMACGEAEEAVVEPTAAELEAFDAEADKAEAKVQSMNEFIENAEAKGAELDAALDDLDF